MNYAEKNKILSCVWTFDRNPKDRFYILKEANIISKEEKYKKIEELGIDYPLKGIPPMDKDKLLDKKQRILEGIKRRRAESE